MSVQKKSRKGRPDIHSETGRGKAAFRIFGKTLFALFFILAGGVLFNLDRMGNVGIRILEYKKFLPYPIPLFLPGGNAVASSAVPHQELRGKVIEVYDGDTITLLTGDNKKYRIRFYGIDAPESAQSFGRASRNALRKKILGEDVIVYVISIDRYQRAVGKVMLNSRNINIEMVAEGMAWHYASYARREYDIANAERNARRNRVGLWQQDNPQSPWNWRRANSKKQ